MRMHLCMGLIVAICCAPTAESAFLRGSVYLMPVDTQFTSHGQAQYLNDLGQPASAVMTGTHRVTGGANYHVFFTEQPSSPHKEPIVSAGISP